jgi:hypothetical protein
MGSFNMVSLFAYGSSRVPSETPKKWIELYWSSDTKWRTPKVLIKPKMGISYSNSEIMKKSGMLPALSTKRGKGVCWNFGMGLGRVTSFNYLFELASNQPTS